MQSSSYSPLPICSASLRFSRQGRGPSSREPLKNNSFSFPGVVKKVMNNCVQALLGVPMGVLGMPNHSDEGMFPTAGPSN